MRKGPSEKALYFLYPSLNPLQDTMEKYSLGIDIAKDKFQCCFSFMDSTQKVTVKASRSFANNPAGFKELLTWTEKNHKQKQISLVIAMEATGVYYEQLALFLCEQDYYVSVLLPNRTKKYFQSLGIKSKNDDIDAKGLAIMGAQQALERWQPLSGYFYKLRTFTRLHESLREQQTVLSNQLHALEHGMYEDKESKKVLKRLIAVTEKEIAALEACIEKHLYSDQEVKAKVAGILKIKGIGILTAATILAETNGFALFESRGQLVSYAGYDVVENQSGNRRGKTRISKKGNSHIRRILHMPALLTVRYEPVFKAFYQRLMERYDPKKEKMKAYVAVQKKLLLLIYALWKKEQTFDPQYPNNQQQERQTPEQPQALTGEEEQAPASLDSAQSKPTHKKSSPAKSRATQGRFTVEESQYAASLETQI